MGRGTVLRYCTVAPLIVSLAFALSMTGVAIFRPYNAIAGNQGDRDQGIRDQKMGSRGSGDQESKRGHFLIHSFSDPLIPSFLILAGLLLLAAWLRWRYIVNVQPNPDEFVTLLAVKMILQKGVPLLPSGLFYEHGLLFSYAGAAASLLFGFSREVVRATSLLFGLLTLLLTWHVGRRWFSSGAGLLAATLLAVAPTAVLWGGRARMYTMLQWWVLLTLYFAFTGALTGRSRWRYLALVCYLAATLTQFVSITLIPPLVLGTVAVGWLGARRRGERPWFWSRRTWLEAGGLVVVALVAFLVKRAGQPKGVAPLGAAGEGVVIGIAQVVAIYSTLSTDLVGSWRALAPFFTAPETIVPTGLALLAMGWAGVNLLRRRTSTCDLPTLFLSLILVVTVVEMLFFVAPDRRDDRYLFMLQPAFFLLAADGLTRVTGRRQMADGRWQETTISHRPSAISFFPLIICLALVIYTWPATSALLARTGPGYDAAFGYVRDHWQEGDAVLTGTPAAAAIYLGRNDYYAVQGQDYAYRILKKDGQLVERWLGSPWIATAEQLNVTLGQPRRVWLVLERWGLLVQYYDREFMQQILAQTEFIREDNGVIVLRSLPDPHPISLEPAAAREAVFGVPGASWQVKLLGYTLEPSSPQSGQPARLTLYWQALASMDNDYRVLVHLRDAGGGDVLVADHAPLGSIYPTTLWQPGEIIRETVTFTLPSDLSAGTYTLLTGMYHPDTLERLPVAGDVSGENVVLLDTLTLHPNSVSFSFPFNGTMSPAGTNAGTSL
jgi:hypothetical protein